MRRSRHSFFSPSVCFLLRSRSRQTTSIIICQPRGRSAVTHTRVVKQPRPSVIMRSAARDVIDWATAINLERGYLSNVFACHYPAQQLPQGGGGGVGRGGTSAALAVYERPSVEMYLVVQHYTRKETTKTQPGGRCCRGARVVSFFDGIFNSWDQTSFHLLPPSLLPSSPAFVFLPHIPLRSSVCFNAFCLHLYLFAELQMAVLWIPAGGRERGGGERPGSSFVTMVTGVLTSAPATDDKRMTLVSPPPFLNEELTWDGYRNVSHCIVATGRIYPSQVCGSDYRDGCEQAIYIFQTVRCT